MRLYIYINTSIDLITACLQFDSSDENITAIF
jgi:hypothetical protein